MLTTTLRLILKVLFDLVNVLGGVTVNVPISFCEQIVIESLETL